MGTQPDDLEQCLGDIIRDHTSKASVASVSVVDDVDHDGDPILRIQVVVRGDSFRLDPQDTLNTSRLVWQALLERKDSRFPIIRYVSEGDLSRLAHAAA